MMQYALFARPVVTIYDLPQTTKQLSLIHI